MLKKLKDAVQKNIIKPILESHSPIKEAALGSAVGMFWGLTPTVGIQMWEVWMTWVLFKFLFNMKFDLVIGTALVWISNPLTMFFMYYGFLLTGYAFFDLLGSGVEHVSYSSFNEQLSSITNNPESGKIDVILEAGKYLLVDLGYPMVIGSLLYAIPFAIGSYFFTTQVLTKTRKKKAAAMGIEYEDWRKRFEHGAGQKELSMHEKKHKQHHKEG
ncbi:MAG: DUF2062 domain-containing protein [SAR324 cluster bacterium]|nr:DUF2062 domain-containing protein [SAR324 cluster bacterium]